MAISEQFRILSIAHYVVGGLHALFSCFGLIHLTMGIMMMADPGFFGSGPESPPPPVFVGALFAVIGGLFVITGWTVGFLTILSGRYIAQQKHRTFSLIMGGVNCIFIPLGTILGVFTLVLLTNESARASYPPKPVA